jgi:hypothetical protein
MPSYFESLATTLVYYYGDNSKWAKLEVPTDFALQIDKKVLTSWLTLMDW